MKWQFIRIKKAQGLRSTIQHSTSAPWTGGLIETSSFSHTITSLVVLTQQLALLWS